MNQQFSVSVVMCTYNGEQFIDEQIESIVKQTAAIHELIIVDDQSTDRTWEKLNQWKEQYAFINVYRNSENLGYNKNFEKAIQLATGELIALSDQDDVWLPEKISRMLPVFNDTNVMLAHCRSVQMKEGKLDFKRTRLQHHFDGSDVRHFFFFNHVMGHDAIFRKELVAHIVPIPAGMSYDWWIAANAIARGRIAGIPEFLVYHRIHSNNSFFSTTAASKKKELDLDETLQILATISALSPSEKEYIEELITLLTDKNMLPKGSFSKPLFAFLNKHRKIVFGHKRRLFPAFAYWKAARKYARFDYKGKGLSF